MKPEKTGPITGPRGGLEVKIAIGKNESCGAYKSDIEPPATVKNALPTQPVKKRKIKKTGALFANATGKPNKK